MDLRERDCQDKEEHGREHTADGKQGLGRADHGGHGQARGEPAAAREGWYAWCITRRPEACRRIHAGAPRRARSSCAGELEDTTAADSACGRHREPRLASIAGARTGSVGLPQRFGSSLNVHVHFHTLAIDGVFEKTAMGARFHDAPPPSKDDVSEVARRVRERALLWLRRRGYLDERAAEERSNETIEPSALDACTQLALAGGACLARPFEHKDSPDAAFERRERRFSAACDGFDVHCAVRIAADDDPG
ncbi:transposase [Sorangium sp. So ce185]